MDHAWTCSCCGRQFNTLPLDYACAAPDQWMQVPEAERAGRGKLDSDVCVIDNGDSKNIFVRGRLEIPIVHHPELFVWGVWVSVSEKSFERIVELWHAPSIDNEPPKFGWLCNNIVLYPATMHLKTHLHLRSGGNRPLIELEPTDHPLAVEQRTGITIERVQDIAAALSLRH